MPNQIKNATGKVNIPKLSDYSVTIKDTFLGPITELKLKSGNTATWLRLTKGNKSEVLSSKEGLQAAIFIVNAKGKVVSGTDKFFLEFISEQISEKVSVSETFVENDPSIYIFGKKNLPITFSGSIYNADHFVKGSLHGQWEKGLKEWWKTSLRAGALVKNGKDLGPQLAVLVADNEIFYGYPIKLSFSKNASEPLMSKFSMTWVLTGKSFIVNTVDLAKFMEFGDSDNIREILANDAIVRRDIEVLRNILNIINRGLASGQCLISDFENLKYNNKEVEGSLVALSMSRITSKTSMSEIRYEWSIAFTKDIISKMESGSMESISIIKEELKNIDPKITEAALLAALKMSSEFLKLLGTKKRIAIYDGSSTKIGGISEADLPKARIAYTKAVTGLEMMLVLADSWYKTQKAKIGVLN